MVHEELTLAEQYGPSPEEWAVIVQRQTGQQPAELVEPAPLDLPAEHWRAIVRMAWVGWEELRPEQEETSPAIDALVEQLAQLGVTFEE